MARSGPVPVMVEMQQHGAGSFEELENLTNIGGLVVMAETTDTTAYGHAVKTKGPTGVQSVSDLELEGFFDPAAGTAFTLIGEPDTSPATVPHKIRITYSTGITRLHDMLFDKRDPVLSLDGQQMFQATAYQAGQTITNDYTP